MFRFLKASPTPRATTCQAEHPDVDTLHCTGKPKHRNLHRATPLHGIRLRWADTEEAA